MTLRLLTLLLCAAAIPAAAQSGTSALEEHVERAQQAQARQDCSTAAREYAAAARLLPSSGELRANLGIALYCNDQFSEAEAALGKALQLKPVLAAPHLFLGLSAFHLSEGAMAIKELQIATRAMPQDTTGYLWLGYAYLTEHKPEDAVLQFERVLQLEPRNVDARYALGETYLEIGRRKAREMQALAPNGLGIRKLAADQDWLLGRSEAGAHPTGGQWINEKEGQLYNETVDAETKANAALQAVMSEAPNSDRAHQIAGDAYSLQRNNEAAVKEYEAVLKTNPKLPGVRLAMANCLMQTERFQDALKVLTEEQSLQPRSADVWASTGRVQQALGDDAGAMASLKKATTLPGTPPAARLLMGKALLRMGDAKGALPQLEEALRNGADPSTTNYLLARAYRAMGDRASMQKALDAYHRSSKDEAERHSASALASDPKEVQTGMTPQEVQQANVMSAKSD